MALDSIEQKLALIDSQLTGRNLHKKIVSTSPLLFAAVGLITGIVIQNYLGASVWLWAGLLLACATATILLFILNHKTSPAYAICYTALLCFVCLGAIRLINFGQPGINDIRGMVQQERKLATIRGVIITEPYTYEPQPGVFAKFRHFDPAGSFYMKINQVESTKGWAEAAGTVRVQVNEAVMDLNAGDYIQAYCWLQRFSGPTNPGQFDVKQYLARKNIFIAANVKSRDGIEVLKTASDSGLKAIQRKIRSITAQALVGDISDDNINKGLLEALLLGYRRNIDNETFAAFRRTGLLHFISLSGLHLGILIAIIWWLCKTAGLQKRIRVVICIIAIGIFLLIVPPRAPTLRAAIIGWVFCASVIFRRRGNPVNTLSLAAIILLLIRPTNLFEAGWQLSFASVAGILLFTKHIQNFLYGITGPLLPPTASQKILIRLTKQLSNSAVRLFSVGFAAWLGGMGVLLYHFYTINPLTSIWTVAAFPLVAVILTAGFLKIIISFLLPSLAISIGFLITGLGDLLIWLVKLIASWQISEILVGKVNPVLPIFYYAVILFAVIVRFRRPVAKKALCTAMISLLIVSLVTVKCRRIYRKDLTVTALDVGKGQAILVQLPGTKNLLFDAGSLTRGNVGQKTIAPFLNYAGISKIDHVVVSHYHMDHINAIPDIVNNCSVKNVLVNGAFSSTKELSKPAKLLNGFLSENNLEISYLHDCLETNNEVKIELLWPNKLAGKDSSLSANDKSLVMLLKFGTAELLFCSDVGKSVQKKLLELFPNLKPDVVVVPHHGSLRTLGADFLEKLNADTYICSCTKSEYERHQAIKPEHNGRMFYTPKDGAITVSVKKDGQIKCRSHI